MSRRPGGQLDCKVYVGDLDPRASEREVEEPFSRIGPLRNVWVARNPPGFAFVEFEDPRDAQDACRHLDGTRIGTTRVKVELSNGKSRRGGGGGGGGGGRRRDDRGRWSPPRRSFRDRSRSRSRDRFRRDRSRSRSPAAAPPRRRTRSKTRTPSPP